MTLKRSHTFGAVMLDIVGTTLAESEREIINHPNTGAVILFARNYETPEQVANLIQSIRTARNGEILIAVDQEGGRVQRFQNGFTRLPPAALYENEPEITEVAGWLMAAELLAVGVDFSFAPVLDVDCGVSTIIGNRAFSKNAEKVTQLASEFRRGMTRAGMAATGKHFPGHGAVALDSHFTLPIDERDLDTIRKSDLQPFRQLIAEGLEGIMPAHVLYSACDTQPAGFSNFWIQKILREELNFNGVVFSDDLSMEGAASVGDFSQRAKIALQAGCDMVLVCNNPTAAIEVLESLPIENNPDRERRLQNMRGKFSMNREQLHASKIWQQAVFLVQDFTKRYS
ncbi:MAG: beta-N-acetylhexosaminidase [Methylococcales bacterium]|nr:beta-N-acetylhexosaminidase [Methylococcales bacterium]MDD5755592.1 beta-N-acetylhexosaminidase [Methylococcales bacterium]